jgi:MiaB/RimO family radical SAM methylthiotransferase
MQITAQDTASYGVDSGEKLGDLLQRICKVKGDFRIRVGMMNPATSLPQLNSILSAYTSDKMYKFLHVPVQSGDNDILHKMNRKYTISEFKEILHQFRSKYPDSVFSTDIIVGFPSETDNQFTNTMKLVQNCKPDITNITRYSARPLTKAKAMKGRIATIVAKKRSRILTQLCQKISEENNRSCIGKAYTILVTKKGRNSTFLGRAENYRTVIVKQPVHIGKFYHAEIVDAGVTFLVGKLI